MDEEQGGEVLSYSTVGRRMRRWGITLAALIGFVLPAAYGQTVTYIHTDAMGSPIAATDASGNLVETSEYAPYGELLNRPVKDAPGYTGHVEDAATGLTYMQERYYDPAIGAFLSVDPVTAYDSGNWRQFNRYAYAFSSPYKFTDPDGRNPIAGAAIGCAVTGPACPVGAGVGAAIGAAVVIIGGIIIYSEMADDSSDSSGVAPEPGTVFDSPNSDDSTTSGREPGTDGKRGSTGGPGEGKRFPRESPETKAGKEGVSCRYCGKETTNKSGQPNSRERDHIDPKSRGGNNSSENEGDSCRTCNREKGARSPDEWKPKEK